MKRLLRLTLGLVLLVLGLLGLVLPVLQGWLFLALAALVLSVDLPFLARIVDAIERRYPSLRHPLQKFRRFLAGWSEG